MPEVLQFVPKPEPREVMDVFEASVYLGVSTDTLYFYAKSGFVPAFKLGNRWRFKRSLIDFWMEAQSKKSMEEKHAIS